MRKLFVTSLVLILMIAACMPAGLAPSDLNRPTGWATCENLQGGHYDLSGGAYDPGRGVAGMKCILQSTGGDMRAALDSALRTYDIVVLDGSNGPFEISSTVEFRGLRNKTLAGINGAVLRSSFQCTPEIKAALATGKDRYADVLPETDGRFRLSNDSTVRSFNSFVTCQSIIDATGDESMAFLRSGFISLVGGSENIIIRNIAFDGPGSIRALANPMIRLRGGSHNIWIDHCLFEDFARVAVGVTKGADCVTVSWSEFRITEQSNGHSLGCLIASNDDNWEDEDLEDPSEEELEFSDLINLMLEEL